MGKLTFGMMTSLDGYINDMRGGFNWGQISEEVHRFAEQQTAATGIEIYGRRMFETMKVWDTIYLDQEVAQVERDYSQVWRKTKKIVVSRTLASVDTSLTRLMRDLTPVDVAALKASTEKDIAVSGPTLAASLLRQGLVDEVSIYFIPVAVGSGTAMFQVDRLVQLERLEVRMFANGVVFMRFRVLNASEGFAGN